MHYQRQAEDLPQPPWQWSGQWRTFQKVEQSAAKSDSKEPFSRKSSHRPSEGLLTLRYHLLEELSQSLPSTFLNRQIPVLPDISNTFLCLIFLFLKWFTLSLSYCRLWNLSSKSSLAPWILIQEWHGTLGQKGILQPKVKTVGYLMGSHVCISQAWEMYPSGNLAELALYG